MITSKTSSKTDQQFLVEYLSDRDINCPNCQYNLRGLSSDSCPECGRKVQLYVAPAANYSTFIIGCIFLSIATFFPVLFSVGVLMLRSRRISRADYAELLMVLPFATLLLVWPLCSWIRNRKTIIEIPNPKSTRAHCVII